MSESVVLLNPSSPSDTGAVGLSQTEAAAVPAAAPASGAPARPVNAPAAPSDMPDADAARAPRRVNGKLDLLLYAGLTLMVLGAYAVSRMGLYDSKSDLSYWMGAAGGIGMLLLLTYPMRKHLGFMRRTGPAGRWFFGHMVLGVAGPMLILLHSQFQVRSLNAGAAYYSMIIVALSGVVGRFLYLRLHRSLNGERETLASLRETLSIDGAEARRLRFAPLVVERCRKFEAFALEQRMVSGPEVIRAMFVMPWVRWFTAVQCRRELRRKLVAVAHTESWSRKRLKAKLRMASRLSDDYLVGVQRVAMFAAWHRVFSWWHVGHVPFVYILGISAVVHVIAVHAY
jgi:hypothetical protein